MSILFPKRVASTVLTPPSGYVAAFCDVADDLLKFRDDDGSLITINVRPTQVCDKSGGTLTGAINDSNVTFTLSNTPRAGCVVKGVQSGSPLRPGDDFTVSGAVVTMSVAPKTTPVAATLEFYYEY